MIYIIRWSVQMICMTAIYCAKLYSPKYAHVTVHINPLEIAQHGKDMDIYMNKHGYIQ